MPSLEAYHRATVLGPGWIRTIDVASWGEADTITAFVIKARQLDADFLLRARRWHGDTPTQVFGYDLRRGITDRIAPDAEFPSMAAAEMWARHRGMTDV